MIISKPLFSVKQIQSRVKEMADEISEDYSGKELFAVGILKGAFMFFSDIVKLIQTPMEIDFLIASSYKKTQSTGNVELHCDLRKDIKDRHVLLIEDIVDTGISLKFILDMLASRNPASLKVCTFIDKKELRKTDVHIDYVGFQIRNEYVVGYGLDYENKFRNLPYIAIFKKST